MPPPANHAPPRPLPFSRPLQAQIDDLKSFAVHLGERMDADAGLGEPD